MSTVQYYGLDWLGTILGLASIYYLGRQRRVGFILRILASLFWWHSAWWPAPSPESSPTSP